MLLCHLFLYVHALICYICTQIYKYILYTIIQVNNVKYSYVLLPENFNDYSMLFTFRMKYFGKMCNQCVFS